MDGKKSKDKKDVYVAPGKHSFECGPTTFVVDKKYEYIKLMGGGAYGVVCAALNRDTGQKVAIKKIPNAFEDLIDAKRILREIKLLNFFEHENIITLLDIVMPDAKTGYNDIYIVTDLMETDLHRVIYSKQQLTDEHVQYFMYQILRAVLYMHSANVIHRDLKPSNILLNKHCDLKICDLGLGRGFDTEEELKTEYVVTRWYRAPEVILNASEYTKAIDIWSIGCIFAELLGRTALFPGEDYLDQIQRVISVLGSPSYDDLSYIGNKEALMFVKGLPKRSKQPWASLYPNGNPVALDLLSKMLTFNPNKRYTVEQCLAHPYFEGIHPLTSDLHNQDEEPLSKELFDWAFDNFEPTKENLQELVYNEAKPFHQPKKN